MISDNELKKFMIEKHREHNVLTLDETIQFFRRLKKVSSIDGINELNGMLINGSLKNGSINQSKKSC